MTWSAGSKAVHKTDWSPLAGRRVTVWPDSDIPGALAALEVAARARQAGAAEVLVILPPDDAPQGWDAADAEVDGWPPPKTVRWAMERRKAPAEFLAWARGRFAPTPQELAKAEAWTAAAEGRAELPAPEPVPTHEPSSAFAGMGLDALRAGRFLDKEPPPIRWLLRDSLPAGTLGLLVSNGGVGKSWFLLQLLMAGVAGREFLDGLYEVEPCSRAFACFAEEDETVIHHRLHAVMRATVEPDAVPEVAEALDAGLFLMGSAGLDVRLVRQVGGNLEPSQAFRDLLTALKGIEGLGLVVLDPLSRFYAGEENDASQATYFAGLLERIARETGATVIASHHIHKGAGKGLKSLHQEAGRGSSGFVNACRWQMNLTSLERSEVAKIVGDTAEHYRYIAGKVVKKNVGRPEDVFYLLRGEGGVLERFEPAKPRAEDHDAAVLDLLVSKVGELAVAGIRKSPDELARQYKGEWHGYGRERLRRLIDGALVSGRLFEVAGKDAVGRPRKVVSRYSTGSGEGVGDAAGF